MKNLRDRVEKLERRVAAYVKPPQEDFSHLSREELEGMLEEQIAAWGKSEDGGQFNALLENRSLEEIEEAFRKTIEANKRGPARFEDFLK